MTTSDKQSLSVVIACGGTGGHLFPGIAVAQELKKRGHRVTLLISKKNVDAEASEQYGDLEFRSVEAVALPKLPSLAMFKFFRKLWKTWRTSKAIFKEVGAEVVVGMGGFTSLPPVVVANRMKLKTFVHDSNALPGKANRLTAKWCDHVLLGVGEAAHYFAKTKCVVTGTPIRAEMESIIPRETARAHFGLKLEDKVVLAMGGSQGAKNLNSLIIEAAGKCSDLCKFIIITGSADYNRVATLAEGMHHVNVLSFCSEMPMAYGAADLVISRSGASSLTELAHVGKPALLVPYPYAADDHQAHNARVFSAYGAAHVCREESLTSDSIATFLRDLLSDETKYNEMQRAVKGQDVPDAAHRIADMIEQI
ncbi:MAG: undecaprenyldiphospho-muramoylpentapeptide beta-N-acetylglucosaminyltransferase [Akkermansia sp.]